MANGAVAPATTEAAGARGSAGTLSRTITDTITGTTSGTKGTAEVAMRLAALVLSFLLATPVMAQDLAPDELVRKVTADVLDAIKSDKQLQAGDRKKALALAEEKILPQSIFVNRQGSRRERRGTARYPEQQV